MSQIIHRPDLGVCCAIREPSDDERRAEVKQARDDGEIRGTWQGALLTGVLVLLLLAGIYVWAVVLR